MADHLRSDLDLVELLAGVDANDAANHLRHDNHVTQVRLDQVGLLVGLGLLLGLAELLDQAHGLALQATVDPATGTGVDDIAELLGVEVQETASQVSPTARAIRRGSKRQARAGEGMQAGRSGRVVLLVGGDESFGVHVRIKVDAAVRELAELSLLLELSGLRGVLYCQSHVSPHILITLLSRSSWVGPNRPSVCGRTRATLPAAAEGGGEGEGEGSSTYVFGVSHGCGVVGCRGIRCSMRPVEERKSKGY